MPGGVAGCPVSHTCIQLLNVSCEQVNMCLSHEEDEDLLDKGRFFRQKDVFKVAFVCVFFFFFCVQEFLLSSSSSHICTPEVTLTSLSQCPHKQT